jgi:hypothetical protein
MRKGIELMKNVSLINEDASVTVSLHYMKAILRLVYLEGCLDVLTSDKVQKGNDDVVPKHWGDIQNIEFEIEALERLPIDSN